MSDIIARFDAVVPCQWEDYAPPTAESIGTIETSLCFKLPSLLLDFAMASKSFSSFFLGLGPDYDHHSHIIAKNRFVRTDPYWIAQGDTAPGSLVFFTENFMGDSFWCFDIGATGYNPPVVLWESGVGVSETNDLYQSVEQFMLAQIALREKRLQD